MILIKLQLSCPRKHFKLICWLVFFSTLKKIVHGILIADKWGIMSFTCLITRSYVKVFTLMIIRFRDQCGQIPFFKIRIYLMYWNDINITIICFFSQVVFCRVILGYDV